MNYDNLSVDELLDITDLSSMYDDNGTILDEVPEISRFVSLDEFLEGGDDEYEKWDEDDEDLE